MRKMLAVGAVLALVFGFTACGESEAHEVADNGTQPYDASDIYIEETTPETEPPPYFQQATPENTYENLESEQSTAGIIEGDVYYNGIAISRIFSESFFEILGEPWGSRDESFFFYDNFQIWGWVEGENFGIAGEINAWPPNLHLFEINGFTLDMNRTELIVAFGNPLEYYENQRFNIYDVHDMTYHISNPVSDYGLIFRFFDDMIAVDSITIWPFAFAMPLDYFTPIELSEYGHVAAQEFLSMYTTLFLNLTEVFTYLGNLLGTNLNNMNEIDAYIRENYRLDPISNWIEREHLPQALLNEPSFDTLLETFAWDFILFDIYGMDAPLIGIHFPQMFANGQTPFRIYKYANGYSFAGWIDFHQNNASFFHDTEGRLLTLTGCQWYAPQLTYISFANGRIVDEIPNPQSWSEWDWDFEVYLTPNLPRASLTPVPILDDLADAIRHNSQPIAQARLEASRQ
ncbi:MAG: hypothetical protein FWC89_08135 [Defluviitaleaceae bacterium]|nr:hypothetical protein [Defluviitaleaceae bacterium]